ncbi:RRM domain-containing protein [Plasmodiophora brassicae]
MHGIVARRLGRGITALRSTSIASHLSAKFASLSTSGPKAALARAADDEDDDDFAAVSTKPAFGALRDDDDDDDDDEQIVWSDEEDDIDEDDLDTADLDVDEDDDDAIPATGQRQSKETQRTVAKARDALDNEDLEMPDDDDAEEEGGKKKWNKFRKKKSSKEGVAKANDIDEESAAFDAEEENEVVDADGDQAADSAIAADDASEAGSAATDIVKDPNDYERTVFVGDLPESTTPKMLYNALSPNGKVLNVRLISHKVGTPEATVFGYVLFDRAAAAQAVLAPRDKPLKINNADVRLGMAHKERDSYAPDERRQPRRFFQPGYYNNYNNNYNNNYGRGGFRGRGGNWRGPQQRGGRPQRSYYNNNFDNRAPNFKRAVTTRDDDNYESDDSDEDVRGRGRRKVRARDYDSDGDRSDDDEPRGRRRSKARARAYDNDDSDDDYSDDSDDDDYRPKRSAKAKPSKRGGGSARGARNARARR